MRLILVLMRMFMSVLVVVIVPVNGAVRMAVFVRVR